MCLQILHDLGVHVNLHYNPPLKLTLVRTVSASLERKRGYDGISLQMDQNSSSSSHPLNGLCPINISYSRTPKDHQSTV